MVLFPIALIWVALVLYWAIRTYAVEPETPDDEPRRWSRPAPNGPDGTGAAPPARGSSGPPVERGRRSTRRTAKAHHSHSVRP